MNEIPMHQGVKVTDPESPYHGDVGTTVDRTEDGRVVVRFADDRERAFSASQIEVL